MAEHRAAAHRTETPWGAAEAGFLENHFEGAIGTVVNVEKDKE